MWCNWWIVFTLLYLCYGSCWHGAECLRDAVGGRDSPRTSSPPHNRRGSAVTRCTAGRKRLKHEWMPCNCVNPLWNHLSCFLNVKWADHCEACYTAHTYLFHCPGQQVTGFILCMLWAWLFDQRWSSSAETESLCDFGCNVSLLFYSFLTVFASHTLSLFLQLGNSWVSEHLPSGSTHPHCPDERNASQQTL